MMNYIYGISNRVNPPCKNLKTVGEEYSNLSGYNSAVRELPDGTKITDHFRILKKYASKEVNGLCYDWYLIDSHYRETDTSAKTQTMIDQLTANLDYISMMSGVDIPRGVEDGT